MGRKRTEINKKGCERLKLLLKDNNMTQREFADLANYSEVHVCGVVNGTRNITEDLARIAAEIFPPTRIQWILGLDDYRTEAEKRNEEFLGAVNESQSRVDAFTVLLRLAGYDVELAARDGTDLIISLIDGVRSGYTIYKGDEVLGRCPLERYNMLAFDMQELAEQRIKSFLREG